jgi:hypothetical protein
MTGIDGNREQGFLFPILCSLFLRPYSTHIYFQNLADNYLVNIELNSTE